MAQTTFTILIDDDYAAPAGALTVDQYLSFVMNMAAKSYKSQYGAADVEAGIQAACDAYNAALPPSPVDTGGTGSPAA